MPIVAGILSGIVWWQLAYTATLFIPGPPMNYSVALWIGGLPAAFSLQTQLACWPRAGFSEC